MAVPIGKESGGVFNGSGGTSYTAASPGMAFAFVAWSGSFAYTVGAFTGTVGTWINETGNGDGANGELIDQMPTVLGNAWGPAGVYQPQWTTTSTFYGVASIVFLQ